VRSPFLIVAAGFGLAAVPASPVLAVGSVPAGYQVVDLNLGSGSFGVSANGRVVTCVAGGGDLTFTLYDRYLPTGRQQIGQPVVFDNATIGGGFLFASNIEFDGESRILFGENGTTSKLYAIDFSAPTPAATALAATTFPGVQGIARTDTGHVIVEGSTNPFGVPGGLYLRDFDPTTGASTPIVENVAGGYASGTGITSAGNRVLLDSNGVANLYTAAGAPAGSVALTGGNGFGAYDLDFDNAGLAYFTTGNTISLVTGIDSATPVVSEFGNIGSGFHAGIVFTGTGFDAGDLTDTGALIVSDGIGERLYAITPIPEPASLSLLIFSGVAILRRSRKGGRHA
jgi:hypothetical protein